MEDNAHVQSLARGRDKAPAHSALARSLLVGDYDRAVRSSLCGYLLGVVVGGVRLVEHDYPASYNGSLHLRGDERRGEVIALGGEPVALCRHRVDDVAFALECLHSLPYGVPADAELLCERRARNIVPACFRKGFK